jgi:CRP-like cAMP-binding protein
VPKEDSSYKFLSSTQPFCGLSEAELKAVLARAREARFAKGEAIFNEGYPAENVWVLREGRVQIMKYASNGRSLGIETLGPGEIFGTVCRLNDSSLGSGSTYPCTAVAAGKVTAIKIPDSIFMSCFRKNLGFSQSVCGLCVKRLKEFQSLRCFSQEPAPVRVAGLLLRLQKSHGDSLSFAKREIAELCGISTETAIRLLSSFERKGWLSSRYRSILIKKADALAALSQRQ